MAKSKSENKLDSNLDNIINEETNQINSNSIDISEELKKELELTNQKNKDLEDKINNITIMMEKLLESQNKINENKSDIETIKSETNKGFKSYVTIDPTKRVLLMQMEHAGGSFFTHNNKLIRFNNYGHINPVRFEDVESLVSRYRDHFENLEIRILNDDDVIDTLYLRENYKKYDISKEEIDNIIELDTNKLIEKIKSLSKPLQESVLALIISNVAKNNPKYLDKNKWEVLNNVFNINIQEFSNKYVIN